MNVDIFKDATSKLTSNIIPIMHIVFYRLFQLINSSNKHIPVYSYQYNQYDMFTSVHVTC